MLRILLMKVPVSLAVLVLVMATFLATSCALGYTLLYAQGCHRGLDGFRTIKLRQGFAIRTIEVR